MTGWLLLAIPLGGVGAVARVVLTELGESRLPGGAPVATALVNVVGAALLGLLAGLVGDVGLLVLGGGLLGGLTTFSTWMVEADGLLRGRRSAAAAAIAGPLLLGAAAYAAAGALA